jgi:RES domain-containing protein
VISYRICKERYVDQAFTGEGSYRYGGRWNSKGRRVVYTGGNSAIAALEIIVHLGEPSDLDRLRYVLIPVAFGQELISRPASLPSDWNADPPPLSAAAVGDDWVVSGTSAVLEVPSAVIHQENNYLMNVHHEEYNRIVIGKPEPFEFDSRLKKLWLPPV